MKAETRFFGTIEIEDEKIIKMDKGMIGFPELTHFTLIFNEEKGVDDSNIMWLQSMDDGDIAFPVMVPNKAQPDYAPNVNDELISPLGELTGDNTFLLVTVSVPKDVEKMTCNLQAPIIINTDNNKAAQVIVDGYPIRFPVYEALKGGKAGE